MANAGWTDEQKLAINLRDGNILVSAAAGSGKTAVLVERIIGIISDDTRPTDIDRLLVVTFTKAAAAEMKGRIADAIEELLIDDPDNTRLQRQAAIMHNAQIATIDSFCQNVIRNYFHLIDLDPSFRVADENELSLMKKEVLDELLEKKYSAGAQNGDDGFLNFVDSFSPGRTDSAIEELTLKLYNVSMSYPWPREQLGAFADMYESKTLGELENAEWMKALKRNVDAAAGDCLDMAKRALDVCRQSDGPYNYEEAILSDIKQIQMVKESKTYAQYYENFSKFNPARLSGKRDSSVSEEKKKLVKAMRETYQKNGMQAMKKNYFFQSPDEMLSDMMASSSAISELIGLTIEFMDLFAEKKREEGVLDFSDMEHFALDILVDRSGAGIAPSEAAMELGEYYKEIMVDEYQDSNFVQELILSAICGTPKEGPHIFMVGDVKQSIYQFRLARPDLFMKKYNSYSLDEGPNRRVDLHKNFRSRKCVIDAVNFIFSRIMKAGLGGVDYDEAARLSPGRAFDESLRRVSDMTDVLVIEQNADDGEIVGKRALEAAAIGNRIIDMIQGPNPLFISSKEGERRASYGDIAILLRSMSGWSEEFVETLTDMGIPAYSETRTGYFSAVEIRTVLDMLRIIDNPRQDIPLAAVMRSPIGKFSDEELAAVAAAPRAINYWDAVLAFMEKNEGGDELAAKLKSFCDVLARYRGMSKYMSVYEILQCIYDETGYYNIMSAMPAGERRAANLDILLQQSIEFADSGRCGIFNFINYIEKLNKANIDFGEAAVNGENTDAVRIMSIHKSKGLQFPIVFVAGMGKQFNLQDARKSVIIDADYGIGADFMDLDLRTRQPTLIKKFMADKIKRNTLAEEIRILYVALTRAEEKLIISGTAANVDSKMEKWENTRGSRDATSLLLARTYFDWIMPAVLDEGQDGIFGIKVLSQDDIVSGEKENLEKSIKNYDALKNMNLDEKYSAEMEKEIKAQTSYGYPYKIEAGLPAKLSVSEIKRMSEKNAQTLILDEDSLSAGELFKSGREGGQPKPKFMKPLKKRTGAEKGVLYHLAMQHLPFGELHKDYDYTKFIADLQKKGCLSAEDAAAIDVKVFQKFYSSAIGGRMRRADADGRLKREQPFMLGLKALEIYGDAARDCDEMILMQGIIDAFFEEDGALVLVDYKSDFVQAGREERLAGKYKPQLDCYASALERITGKEVKEKIIYSFSLGAEIHVPV